MDINFPVGIWVKKIGEVVGKGKGVIDLLKDAWVNKFRGWKFSVKTSFVQEFPPNTEIITFNVDKKVLAEVDISFLGIPFYKAKKGVEIK